MPTLATDPLQEAVAALRSKVPVGSKLTSREWEDMAAEFKARAFFSARVENERLLAEMKSRLQVRIDLAKKDGATMDRGRFIEEMQAEVARSGYKRGEARRGSLQDLKSQRRQGVIWDMNVAQAQGYAAWKSAMDPDVLDAFPCQELVRVIGKINIRDWPIIWEDHGGKFYGEPGKDYPNAPGRMVAKITDDIWRRISRFKTPWAPFDWGSGMRLRKLSRTKSVALGVMGADEVLTPLSEPFNAATQASLEGIPAAGRENLRSTFGDTVKVDGEKILIYTSTQLPSYGNQAQNTDEFVRDRARDLFRRADQEFQRLQQELDGAGLGFQGEDEREIARIYLAQTSAVAVGRKALFHDTMTPSQAALFEEVVTGSDKGLTYHYAPEGGHVMVWRDDLNPMAAADVLRQMEEGKGGLLMGYGMDEIPERNQAAVLVKIYTRPRGETSRPVAGFYGPVERWRVFAEARARDISDAWGVEVEIETDFIR